MIRAVNSESLERLRIRDFALELYANGFASIRLSNQIAFQELPFEISDFSLIDGDGKPLPDKAAASIIYKNLRFPSTSFSTDERIWVSLVFDQHFEYSKRRWAHTLRNEEDIDSVANHLQNHFFCATSKSRFRDHALSRLWWIQRYIERSVPTDKAHATEMLLGEGFSDFPNNLLGRPNIAAVRGLAGEIIEFAYDLFVTKGLKYDRVRVRSMMSNLDMAAGHQVPDLIDKSEIRRHLEKAYSVPILEPAERVED